MEVSDLSIYSHGDIWKIAEILHIFWLAPPATLNAAHHENNIFGTFSTKFCN
jgi:hypothetical protein